MFQTVQRLSKGCYQLQEANVSMGVLGTARYDIWLMLWNSCEAITYNLLS
jgi:hypothetical protein